MHDVIGHRFVYQSTEDHCFFFFFQAEDGIRDIGVTGVQTCALPIFLSGRGCGVTDHWEDEMEGRGHAGVGGDERNLARVLNDALREADACGGYALAANADRKSVVEGKRVDLGGRRIIKKKKITDVVL